MKKFSAADFYFRISIWTFLCLFPAAACHQINPLVTFVLKDGNEASAAQSIQTIKALQAQYASKHQGKFAANFDELIKEVWLDERFGGQTPVVNGYVFSMRVEEPTAVKPAFYSVNADPRDASGIYATGTRHFYYDSALGTTRQTEENRPATADDPII